MSEFATFQTVKLKNLILNAINKKNTLLAIQKGLQQFFFCPDKGLCAQKSVSIFLNYISCCNIYSVHCKLSSFFIFYFYFLFNGGFRVTKISAHWCRK